MGARDGEFDSRRLHEILVYYILIVGIFIPFLNTKVLLTLSNTVRFSSRYHLSIICQPILLSKPVIIDLIIIITINHRTLISMVVRKILLIFFIRIESKTEVLL